MMKKSLAAGIVALVTLVGSSAAGAASIGFEDVTNFTDIYGGTYYHGVDTAYGVRWTGGRYDAPYWGVYAPGQSRWFPYDSGNFAHSGNNYIAGYMGESLKILGTDITLTSMWARVGGTVNPVSGITIWAYKNEQEIGKKSFDLSETYQFLDINFSGADSIIIAGGSGYFIADDLVLTNVGPVPEPEAYAMVLAGLGLVGLAARRKRAAK